MSQVQYLDLEAGLARVRDNKKIYQRMLGLFLSSKEFDAFEESMAQHDLPKAADIIHGIKGMTGNLAMPELFAHSSDLMVQLRNGSYDPAVLALYRDAVANTRKEVEGLLALWGQ